MARIARSSMTLGPGAPDAGDQPVAPGVQGLDAGAETGGARSHLELGLLVVGEGEDAAGLVAPVGDQMAEPLGEYPGLPRPGGGDHPGRAGVVVDGGELFGVERRRRQGRGGDRVEPSRLDGLGVDHSLVGEWSAGAGPAVDPGRARRAGSRQPCLLGPPRPRGLCAPTTTPAHRRGRRSCSPTPGSGAGRATARTRDRPATVRSGGRPVGGGLRCPPGGRSPPAGVPPRPGATARPPSPDRPALPRRW